MAAIGDRRAQKLITDAQQVGLTPADLGRISGRGEDWLENMSKRELADCEREIERRRPAPVTSGSAGRTGWSRYSRNRDQVGGYMADSFGLTSPASARRECHYCGGPLNRGGYCDQCQ